jgi:HlyD family secretion protein
MGVTAQAMGMDVSRVGYPERRRRRRWYLGGAALVALAAATWALGRLEPAPPSVDRDTVYFGTVERGRMLRQVRGHGTLVPVEMRWIPARTRGRIERIRLRPGALVEPDSVILELSNPEVEQAALDAEKALVRAVAELASLEVMLGSQELDLRAQAAAVEAEYQEAELWAEAERELAAQGLMSEIQSRITEGRAASLATRHEIAEQRVVLIRKANAAQLDAKRAEVAQHRALAELRSGQRGALRVKAGLAGVIQEIPFEVGQEVGSGASLALVAEPSRLQAEIRIPATQARELQIGQVAHIDTRNGIVDGRVARIDPNVRRHRGSGRRGLHRSAGLGCRVQHGRALPGGSGRGACHPYPGAAGPRLGERHRGARGAVRGRPGRHFRHASMGRARTTEIQVGASR